MVTAKALAPFVGFALFMASFGLATDAGATLLLEFDVEQLSQHADTVVLAEVEETFVAWHPRRTAIYTHAKVRVVEVIAGAVAAEDVLHVVQLGGTVDGYTQRFGGAPTFAKGERTVLFLEERVTGTGERVEDHWLVTGLFQGKFQVDLADGVLTASRPFRVPGVELVNADGKHTAQQADAVLRITLSELSTRVRAAKTGVKK